MDKNFVKTRICEILDTKQRSLRQASLDLGFSDSYLNAIVNGRIELKINVLLQFCEYMEITPVDFFKTEPAEEASQAEKEIHGLVEKMTPKDKDFVCDMIRRFWSYRKQMK